MTTVQRKPRAMPGSERALYEAIESIAPDLPMHHFRRAFDLIEIAEEEIASAYPRKNGKPTDPPGLFMALCPSEVFRDKSDSVFRHHVRELIARSRTKRPDYSIATEAEVLLGMLEASKVAPLTTQGMVIVDRLFPKITGREFGVHTAEQWPGQYDEALSEARRKVKTGRAR